MKLVRIICKTHELKYFQNMVITIENKVSRCCNCYKRGLQQIFENTKEEKFCYIVNTTTVPIMPFIFAQSWVALVIGDTIWFLINRNSPEFSSCTIQKLLLVV